MKTITQSASRPTLALTRGLVAKLLLCCGVLASIFYVAFDAFAASQYPGYSYASQAVSELSAVGAPTASLYRATGPTYSLLMIAFGLGAWLAGYRNRALRVTAGLIIAYTILGLAWPYFPMHQRGAQGSFSDTMHIILAVASVLSMIAIYWFGAKTFGQRFRLYTLATLATSLLFGAITFLYAPRIAQGLPTPGMGITERINIFLYLIWVVVLAHRSWPAGSEQ